MHYKRKNLTIESRDFVRRYLLMTSLVTIR